MVEHLNLPPSVGQGCPAGCNRRGLCTHGRCVCVVAWSGDDCSVPVPLPCKQQAVNFTGWAFNIAAAEHDVALYQVHFSILAAGPDTTGKAGDSPASSPPQAADTAGAAVRMLREQVMVPPIDPLMRLLGKSCALVGSSDILLSCDVGQQIDAHDVVIRLNDAPTVGYERNVGSRTTLRFQGTMRAIFREGDEFTINLSHPFLYNGGGRNLITYPEIAGSTGYYMCRVPCAFALDGCLFGNAQPADSTCQSLTLGVILDMSGASSSVSTDIWNGVRLAADHISCTLLGSPSAVSLQLRDSGDTVDGAASAAEALLAIPELAAVIGPTRSPQAAAVASRATLAGVPVVAVSHTSVSRGLDLGTGSNRPHFFLASLGLDQLLKATVGTLLSLNRVTTVSILYDSDSLLSIVEKERYVAAFASFNVTLLSAQSIQTGDSLRSSTQVETVMTSLVAGKPGALALLVLPVDLPLALTLKHRLKYNGIVVGAGAMADFVASNAANGTGIAGTAPQVVPLLWHREGVSRNLTRGASGNTNSSSNNSSGGLNNSTASGDLAGDGSSGEEDVSDEALMLDLFLESYVGRYGHEPTQWAAHGYTGVQLVAAGIRCWGAAAVANGSSTTLINFVDNYVPPEVFKPKEAALNCTEAGRAPVGGWTWDRCSIPPAWTSDTVFNVAVMISLQGGARGVMLAAANGFELAVRHIHSSCYLGPARLRLDMYEAGESIDTAVALVRKLVSNSSVLAILGPTYSSQAFATNPIAQAAGVVVLGYSNSATGVTAAGNYIFRNSIPGPKLIRSLAGTLVRINVTSVSIMYDVKQAFAVDDFVSFSVALQAVGIPLRGVSTYVTGDTTKFLNQVRTNLLQLLEQNPGGVVVLGSPSESPTIVVQLRLLGFKGVIMGANGLVSDATLAEPYAEGVLTEAVWHIKSSHPSSLFMAETYKDYFNQDPNIWVAQAYSAPWLIAGALRCGDGDGSQSVSNRTLLRDSLRSNVVNFPIPLGNFSFDAERNPDFATITQVNRNKTWQVFDVNSFLGVGTASPPPPPPQGCTDASAPGCRPTGSAATVRWLMAGHLVWTSLVACVLCLE
eukprot:jgi/Mesvir1/5399/Mv15472-RA.1